MVTTDAPNVASHFETIRIPAHAIVYFRRRRIGSYFLALWLSFETRFMEKVRWLQACVENGARATVIAQQQIECSSFTR